ncbi:unnamed protein product [Cunninghamella echinulata]
MSLIDNFLESTETNQEPSTILVTNNNNVDTNGVISNDRVSINEGNNAPINTSVQLIPSTIFSLDYVHFSLPALLFKMVVSNNILLAILSNNRILQIELARKQNDGRIINAFFDPTGRHLIISTELGENYYLFETWKKTKQLSRLKGMVITAIAWNNQATPSSSATREILLGTNQGQIYETWIEPTDEYFKKEEIYVTLVYTLNIDISNAANLYIPPQQIIGIHFDSISSATSQHTATTSITTTNKYFVMATTSSRLYQFFGQTTSHSSMNDNESTSTSMFGSLFAPYTMNAQFLELPGNIGWSKLCFYNPKKMKYSPNTFAWVTGPGIFQGRLRLGKNTTNEIIDNSQLIQYPTSILQDGKEQEQADKPIDVVITPFHIILLYRQRIKVLCYINNKTVYEESLPLDTNEKIQGLAVDNMKKTYWIYTTAAVYELIVHNEDNHVWKLYLEKKDYVNALKYCKNIKQKDKVYIAHADDLYKKKQYQQCASYYAMSSMSFEQATLKFITKKEKDALMVYLLAKLKQINDKHKTQKCLIATWLVELYLAKINQCKEMAASVAYTSTIRNGNNGATTKGQTALEYHKQREMKVKTEFKDLLKIYQDYFHRDTVYKLISSHGHNDELIYYATLINDNDRLISHWIKERNWIKVLEILGKQTNLDMYYKYSPLLMEHIPRETVDIWIVNPNLNPRMLIPSLLRYDHNTNLNKVTQHQAIRYLSYVVNDLNNTDPAVYNSLLTLYATLPTNDETALLSFLKNEGREMLYNPEYALRLCSQYGRIQSCIHLYGLMGLYEEAVHLALKIGDLDLARIQADKPFDDIELQKKLWLSISKYVIQQKKDIKKALEYLKQSNILKIEDILPFFPDFILIDEFKDDIYKTLEECNQKIGTLKLEMDEATKNANNIRLDIRNLKSRCNQLNYKDQCYLCEFPLLTRLFYVFPCGHSYHTDCLKNKVIKNLPYRKISRISYINEQLALDVKRQNKLQNEILNFEVNPSRDNNIIDAQKEEFKKVNNHIEKLKNEYDDIIASECLYCGYMVIDSIDEPFISADELNTVNSWKF